MTYAGCMRIFAIGDTHLSRARPKPMDIFGPQWTLHEEHIRDQWNAVAAEDDLLLIAGDISWAMHLDEARVDLAFLDEFRGTKLLLRGNHDYWWGSVSRIRAIAPLGIEFLQNDAHVYDGIAIAGTRGWTLPPSLNSASASISKADAEAARIYERELDRMRLSLSDLRGREFDSLILMTHYPPLDSLSEATAMSDLIEGAGAGTCVYGHLHGPDTLTAAQGWRNGVYYKLVSADAVEFAPWQVWPPTRAAGDASAGETSS